MIWSIDTMPEQTGKIAIVTGSNIGLGFKIALELARKNATVILACRNMEKVQRAIEQMKQDVPNAKLDAIQLDLIDPDSIKTFVEQFKRRYQKLDILINNAGAVNLETLQHTPNGQEMHMATNHLGHFMLTALLADMLMRTDNARVVTVTSAMYRYGVIDFDDFKWEKRPYHRMKAYSDSKLANLLFSYQLQKYFERKGANTLSLAAHPGLTATDRQQNSGVGGFVGKWIASPIEKGARSLLLCATAPFVKGGSFYAPRFQARGKPALQTVKDSIITDELAQKLWDYSEEVTGVRFG